MKPPVRPALFALAVLAGGCGSSSDDQGLRQKELELKAKELALQKKSLELQEQQLQQDKEHQVKMEELMAAKSAAPAEPSSSVQYSQAAPAAAPPAVSTAAAAIAAEQLEMQKRFLELQEKMIQQMENPNSIAPPSDNPYLAAPAPQTNNPEFATTQNAQSSEMQQMFQDLRRRSGGQ